MATPRWKKSPPELVRRFDALVTPYEQAERSSMFGYGWVARAFEAASAMPAKRATTKGGRRGRPARRG